MSLGNRFWALLRRISGVDGAESTPGLPIATVPSSYQQAQRLREAAILASSTRCTACGLCDVAFDAYELTERLTFRGPSELPLTYARHPDDHSAAKRYIASLRRGDLVALSRLCPVGIPFGELADCIERRAWESSLEAPLAETERTRHDPG